MKARTIQKSIEINAPKEVVWDVMLHDIFTRIWYKAFSEGAHAVTDWKRGSKAVFKDNSGNGIVGRVIENQLYEVVAVVYEGLVVKGEEEYESEQARQVQGARETYRLTEKAGLTQLAITSDMAPECYDTMSVAWDNALRHIQILAESNGEPAINDFAARKTDAKA